MHTKYFAVIVTGLPKAALLEFSHVVPDTNVTVGEPTLIGAPLPDVITLAPKSAAVVCVAPGV
jgi:hypothetical protein